MVDTDPGFKGITVAYDPGIISPEEVLAAAASTGYTIRLVSVPGS